MYHNNTVVLRMVRGIKPNDKLIYIPRYSNLLQRIPWSCYFLVKRNFILV